MKRQIKSPPDSSEKLVSRRWAGEKLGVCIETLKRMEKRGQLKAVRFNQRLLRYRASEIEALVQQASV